MKRTIFFILVLTFSVFAQINVHHTLDVTIDPAKSTIDVVDKITIKKQILKDEFVFKLNEALKVELLDSKLKLEIIKSSFPAKDVGMDRDDVGKENLLSLNQYRITGFDKNNDLDFSIHYSGKIHSPIKQSEENYQRGFSESPGIISNIGVYLAGSTYWIPTIENEMVSFKLTTTLPSLWKTVAQGKRVEDKIEGNKHIDTWDSPTPQEEIFLIAAKFNEYKYSAGSVDAFAFLRTPDEGLANKYLETTAQYLEMYRQLLGPFPYTKFALVENFWETGYGMPSFTLLGQKIIRFPFILHSSYPHELLHNWWGNSVYVDFDSGNWCEGLTAYMADHLIKEQRQQAVEYRRATLQKFTNYVNEENDFPLNKFLSRHDSPSEAIGYGKLLMVFHMLRQKVGDENFVKAMQSFNRANKFKKASFKNIQTAFEDVTNEKLNWFFDQWINRTGAPELKLKDVNINKLGNVYDLKFTIEQIQKDEKFILDIPIVIVDKNGTHRKIFRIDDKIAKFNLKVKDKPLKILIDPQFDLMRRLDTKETPPAFTKAYGSKKTVMILPDESDINYNLYKNFTDGWIKGKEDKFEVLSQNDIYELPKDKTVWILGKTNSALTNVESELNTYQSFIKADSIKLDKKVLPTTNNSFLIALSNPKNIEKGVLLLVIENEKSVPGLLRKLPHYGKYSYLAFEGEEPTNIHKGQWEVINSPLVKNLTETNVKPKYEKRKALAKLAPAFSANRMMKHIEFLASNELKGRELGSKEIDLAADYIIKKFEEYGLAPGNDDGSYLQIFEKSFPVKGILKVKNIIGIIPGTNPELKDALVLSAHYDHLGLGWPDVRKGNEGKIHNGADDNASGVSVLLELAKSMGKTFKPARTIIFVAFSAEEAGLVGSKYFVENYKKFPSEKIFTNLNFDTVGRLFNKKIMILNGNTAREWKFIFMGTEYTTGIATEMITQKLDASDQISFINKGIPAIQIFSGPNADYHKPSDTIEKIDKNGLVKVATIGKEVVQYLSERIEPMNFTGTIKSGENAESKQPSMKKSRKVSTGTMPDFTYSGQGVKVGAVMDDSPGVKAGLMKGDIIKKLNGKEITTLKDYSDLLKEYEPGDEVKLEVDRNGEIKILKLILAER